MCLDCEGRAHQDMCLCCQKMTSRSKAARPAEQPAWVLVEATQEGSMPHVEEAMVEEDDDELSTPFGGIQHAESHVFAQSLDLARVECGPGGPPVEVWHSSRRRPGGGDHQPQPVDYRDSRMGYEPCGDGVPVHALSSEERPIKGRELVWHVRGASYGTCKDAAAGEWLHGRAWGQTRGPKTATGRSFLWVWVDDSTSTLDGERVHLLLTLDMD